MLQSCPPDLKLHHYRRYVGDFFVLITSPEHLEAFRNFLNGQHAYMSYTIVNEKQNRMSFLVVQIIHEDEKFTFSLYGKATFTAQILTALYHLPICLVLSTHSLIDDCRYTHVGLNYVLN